MLKKLMSATLVAMVFTLAAHTTTAQTMEVSNFTACDVGYELVYANIGTCTYAGTIYGTVPANTCPNITPPTGTYFYAITWISLANSSNRSTVGSSSCAHLNQTGSVDIGTPCGTVTTGYANPESVTIF